MSWKISKFHEKEIGSYVPHLVRFINTIKSVPANHTWPSWKIYLAEIGHAWRNLDVEFFRSFAYTLGHVLGILKDLAILYLIFLLIF